MASNFSFFFHKTTDSLHVKLYGDFDGTSALELINALKTNHCKSYQIFIDTDDLNKVSSFGRNVFQKKFGMEDIRSNALIFLGKHKYDLTL